MRLPSANDCVCSVEIVAQKGTPFTGAASMLLSKCMLNTPLPMAPAITGPLGSGGAWAATLTAVRAQATSTSSLVLGRMCFLQVIFKCLLHDTNPARNSVRANQDVREYRLPAARGQRPRR